MYGKSIRLSRLKHLKSGKLCIVPIDHGTTLGPIEGIRDYIGTVSKLIEGEADAIVVHKGILREISCHPQLASRGRFIMHMSVSTALSHDPSHKILVGNVREAMMLGADGVSVHVNLGTSSERDMIDDLSVVSRECLEWGMPLMAMVYSKKDVKNAAQITHAARLAEELGADIVKIDYPGTVESLQKVIECVRIPVVIAGGEKLDKEEELLYMIDDAMGAGASGVAVGRNIFQHRNPQLMTGAIANLVHGEGGLDHCLRMLDADKNRNYEYCYAK